MNNLMVRDLAKRWRDLAEAEAASREQALKDITILIRRYEIDLDEIVALCVRANPEAQ